MLALLAVVLLKMGCSRPPMLVGRAAARPCGAKRSV